jgi:hypothetical protein
MNWKTTFAGILAALGQGVSAVGVLPPPWGVVAQLLSAIGLALLGYHSADRTPPIDSRN